MTIQLESKRTSEWEDLNPILHRGEPGYDWIKNKLKVGDGVSAWNDLPYFADSENWFSPNSHYIDLTTLTSARLGHAEKKAYDKNVGFVIPPMPLAASTALSLTHSWASNPGDKSGILLVSIVKMADNAGTPITPTDPGMSGGYLFVTVDADGNMVDPPTVTPTGWSTYQSSGHTITLTSPSTAGYYGLEVNFIGNY